MGGINLYMWVQIMTMRQATLFKSYTKDKKVQMELMGVAPI